jgi:hypothetical protein
MIERLCSSLEFEHDEQYDKRTLESLIKARSEGLIHSGYQPLIIATICYQYPHHNNDGRLIAYSLIGDPVEYVSINRAYPEDLLPIVNVLNDISPFLIFDPTNDQLNKPEELFYSLDDWLQKTMKKMSCHFSMTKLFVSVCSLT